MRLVINGQERVFDGLAPGSHLDDLVRELGLKEDRVAVEYEGAIVSRPAWQGTPLSDSAKIEIVHFVGGGAGRKCSEKFAAL